MILLSVGLGCFFVLGVRTLQQNLVAESVIGVRQGSADLFLIDIQPDQADGIRAMLDARQEGATSARLVPTLRARVTGVRGRDLNLESYADVRGRGVACPRVHGDLPRRDRAERSRDKRAILDSRDARRRCRTGGVNRAEHPRTLRHQRRRPDALRYRGPDVGGQGHERSPRALGRCAERRLHVRVSPRRAGARAHTFVGFVRGPAAADARARLQFDIVSKYPNVSAIDARDVIARIQKVVDNIVLAISVVGGIALASGVLILVGAVAMTKFQRVYEAAVLRTLGASTRLLTAMVALEYSALGLLAGLIGASGRAGAQLGRDEIPLQDRLAAAARPARRRRDPDHRARRRRRRPRQQRGAAAEAARCAARRVSTRIAWISVTRRGSRGSTP